MRHLGDTNQKHAKFHVSQTDQHGWIYHMETRLPNDGQVETFESAAGRMADSSFAPSQYETA